MAPETRLCVALRPTTARGALGRRPVKEAISGPEETKVRSPAIRGFESVDDAKVSASDKTIRPQVAAASAPLLDLQVGR
jgi:hypothetical protein